MTDGEIKTVCQIAVWNLRLWRVHRWWLPRFTAPQKKRRQTKKEPCHLLTFQAGFVVRLLTRLKGPLRDFPLWPSSHRHIRLQQGVRSTVRSRMPRRQLLSSTSLIQGAAVCDIFVVHLNDTINHLSASFWINRTVRSQITMCGDVSIKTEHFKTGCKD